MTTLRTVRRLQLRAPDEQQAQRAVLLLEDALRTASLHDEGARLILVRKLPLHRIPSDAPPQSVALTLEQAVAQLAIECLHGGKIEATEAAAVWFRDTTEAYTLLALGRLAGRAMDAWYWRLAVPEWTPSGNPAEELRRLGLALAARDDAPASLPRWFTAIADAGFAERLTTAFSPSDLRTLAMAAQLPVMPTRRSRRATPAEGGGHPERTRDPAPETPDETARALLRDAYRILGEAPAALPAGDSAHPQPDHRHPATDPVQQITPVPPGNGGRQPGFTRAQGPAGNEKTPMPIGQHRPYRRPQPPATTVNAAAAQAHRELSLPSPRVSSVPTAHRWHAAQHLTGNWPTPAEPTAAGGLLFMPRVLEYCGYGNWLEAQPEWQDHPIALRVLEQILARLRVDPADPIRTTLRGPPAPRRLPRSFLAPRCWRTEVATSGSLRHATAGSYETVRDASGRLLLAAWRGARPRAVRELLDDAGADSAPAPGRLDAASVTEAWLIACRRWLRRHARIGLADLVLRPAALASSATHLDLWFEHAQADLRIRRTGLDLDPGWVPWLRRVVSFHYGSSWPLGT